MCGIDVHMDPNIGKRLNALGNTLTSLTGEEDVDDIADLNSVNMADLSDEDEADSMSPTIHMVSDWWPLLLLPILAVCDKNNVSEATDPKDFGVGQNGVEDSILAVQTYAWKYFL